MLQTPSPKYPVPGEYFKFGRVGLVAISKRSVPNPLIPEAQNHAAQRSV